MNIRETMIANRRDMVLDVVRDLVFCSAQDVRAALQKSNPILTTAGVATILLGLETEGKITSEYCRSERRKLYCGSVLSSR